MPLSLSKKLDIVYAFKYFFFLNLILKIFFQIKANAAKLAAKYVVGKYKTPTKEEKGYMEIIDKKEGEVKYIKS